MKRKYILSIDQSTSGTKALLVNGGGKIVCKKAVNHQQIYPQPGWVEHNPLEIYNNVSFLLTEVIEGTSIKEIAVLAITNQCETIVVWDKETGKPVYNAIVWQCRRSTDICEKLQKNGYEAMVQSKTGLSIDPYFSATKVKWILDNISGVKEKADQGKLLLGTIDSWIIWKLTKGNVHATDFSNASRTLLFNIHTLQWDQELLELFGIPRSMLPEVKGSNELFGVIEDTFIPVTGLPISGVIGDSQAALFGQKCFDAGTAKATYGTGTSVMLHTGKFLNGQNGLATTIAWGIDGEISYALEGIINSTGDVIKWLNEDIGLISDIAEAEELATSIADNEGVYFIPAFVGLGAPYWSPNTRAAILGMSRSTGKSQITRAALESIAYQVKDVMELLQVESGIKIKELKVDGGATSNRFLMQFQSDMLNMNVVASGVPELSAMGSVYLAGLATGIWSSTKEIKDLYQVSDVYEANMNCEAREKNYQGWKDAVKSVLI